MLANDTLYHDTTVFDQLFAWGKQQLQDHLPEKRQHRWGWLFYGFSLMFGGIALTMLLTGVRQDSPSAMAADLISISLLGLSARHFMQIALQALKPEKTRPVSTGSQTRPIAHKPRHFFKAVRKAGVNVKIARALYAGGIQSVKMLNYKTDQELLIIHGVGPATVRKLRSHFSSAENYYVI